MRTIRIIPYLFGKPLYSGFVFFFLINALTTQKESPNHITIYPLDHWNEVSTRAMHNGVSESVPIPPMIESRIYAMVSIAMHNVVNTIAQKYKTYHFSETGFEDANASAAIAVAVHDILIHELPGQKVYLDSMVELELETLPLDTEKRLGVTLGHHVATSILDIRAADYSDKAAYPGAPGSKPGEYRFTAPFDYHFRHATEVGEETGKKIAKHIIQHAFK
ncbi:MAG: hypothetical protein IPL46_18580 [Saprospiraceae bacterium]|nr:hypothetical protein [Saprospiraceae bacterium]